MSTREEIIRAENVERLALADLHRAASTVDRRALGLAIEVVDGVLVSIAGRHPSIVVNRAIGLGLAAPARPSTVERIVSSYREAGVGRYFVHLDPAAAPEDLERWLGAAGLAPYHRAWAKFTRGAEPAPQPQSDLEVHEIGMERAGDFGRIAAAGFGLHSAWAGVLAAVVGRPGWRVYLSSDGERAAGCAAMRVHEGTAWLDWAATLPEFRRRGSQQALLARRITDGLEAGVRHFVTCTGEAVDGDPQHSFRNILRAGFARTHARANWVEDPLESRG